MLGLPALIAGLVLLLAGSHWFAGAATVGIILTGVGAVFVAVPLLIIALVAVGLVKR